MAGAVKPIPEGREAATPYLCCQGAADAIQFYQRAFGARELYRIGAPGGRVGHAEIMIGAAVIMLSDEYPDMGVVSPATLGGSPVTISLYVEDVDAFAKRAVDAGAEMLRPVEDQFYGDRAGKLRDPFGHVWHVASHVEDVSPDEMERRTKAMFGGSGS